MREVYTNVNERKSVNWEGKQNLGNKNLRVVTAIVQRKRLNINCVKSERLFFLMGQLFCCVLLSAFNMTI